jgi:hypothetical protein
LFDGSPAGTPPRAYLEKIVQAVPHPITVANNSNLAEIMNGLAADLKGRSDDEQAARVSAVFLFFHGL